MTKTDSKSSKAELERKIRALQAEVKNLTTINAELDKQLTAATSRASEFDRLNREVDILTEAVGILADHAMANGPATQEEAFVRVLVSTFNPDNNPRPNRRTTVSLEAINVIRKQLRLFAPSKPVAIIVLGGTPSSTRLYSVVDGQTRLVGLVKTIKVDISHDHYAFEVGFPSMVARSPMHDQVQQSQLAMSGVPGVTLLSVNDKGLPVCVLG